MKIGIDLDGVVIDSETTFRTYEEIYDIDYLKGNNLINKEEPKFQARYRWTNEQEQDFIQKYFLKVSKESNLMSGFVGVYDLLKNEEIEFIVITARGGFVKEMKDDALRLLKENNVKFDKYYWNVEDKLEVCQKENIDIMIDDDWKIIKKLSDNKIRTLYFRDTNLKVLEENQYIKEVNNWGEIYRYIKELEHVDIYDENKEKTGRIKIRHFDTLEEGEYIIGVQAIIINSKNEILISQRAKNKKYPLLWECNGGCMKSGENGIQGIIREIKEELGIEFKMKDGIFFKSIKKKDKFKDLYLFKKDIDIKDLRFSDREVLQAKWVTINEFEKMVENNEIVPNIDFTSKDYEECLKIIDKE